MIRVGVIGATGYTGEELVRLLLQHKHCQITYLTSTSYAGSKMDEIYPNLKGTSNLVLEKFSPLKAKKNCDVIFIGLPHGESMNVVPKIMDEKIKIIDLSADFRFSEKSIYKKWYKMNHQAEKLLGKAVYGLPEINKESIKKSKFVANPGCYPTSVLLALAPLLKQNLIKAEDIIVDAKSGVSGAGRTLTLETHFSQINENMWPYRVGVHQHLPEMEEQASLIAGKKVKIVFTPHLIPINRGILSTIYTEMKDKISAKNIFKAYKQFYKKEPFVKILDEENFPQTKAVQGSNYCHIGLKVLNDKIIIISALDNLVKGASGQAIQNLNLMCGLDETEGLEMPGLFP